MTLRPRLATPAGFAISALVLAWLGERTLTGVGFAHGWWLGLPLLALASLQGLAALRLFRHRGRLLLHVDAERFTFGDISRRHFQVTSVRRYKDLRFKGVRVDLGSDQWVTISASYHEPGAVLAAFRTHGYPVEGV